MELFRKNSSRQKAVNHFCKKALSLMFGRVLNTYTKFPTFPAVWKTLYSVWLFPVDQRKKMRFNPLKMPGGNNSS